MPPPEDTGLSGLLEGQGIICLSSIDWDFLWQAHQEVMSRFAAAGNPVLFIENTGVRSPNLSDLPRLVKRLGNWWKGVQGFQERAPNLIVLSPLLLPFPYSRLCRWINTWLLSRSVNRWVAATRRANPILWTFLPTPLVYDLIEELDPSLVVYYCADNLAASSSSAQAVETSERKVFARANLVFATSRAIKLRAERSCAAAHFFPFGVDFKQFADWKPSASEPADVAAIPHPRVGYVGGIHRWVDFNLLLAAAEARPGYHFVLVGPEQTDASELKELPNVHFLGTKPHEDLPAYIAAFDAAVIPYRLTDYTDSVYPTKLNEYFAMGVPVVSTSLPEVVRYSQENGCIVHIADGEGSFMMRLDEALVAPSLGREARIAAAKANGWDERVKTMSALMLEALKRRRAEPEMLTGVLPRLVAGWRPWGLAIAAGVLALGLLRLTPLPWILAGPLRASASPFPADAVVVLGGGAGESGEIGQGHQERIERAINLHAEGLAPRIVLCAGKVQTYSEAEVMRAIALAKGVPDHQILIEPEASGTLAMVSAAVRLARVSGWKRVLLVSSPYHMGRAQLVWKKQAPDIEAAPTPVLTSRFYGYDARRPGGHPRGGATFRQARGLLQEVLTLLYYRLRGWV